MRKTALTLMIITLISKITGLIREQFFAYFLGTGPIIDAYNTASTIPYIMTSFIMAGVVATFIPIYSRIEKEDGRAEADKFTSNLINILLILSTLIIIFTLIFAPLLVSIFAPGYEDAKKEITIQFTRILSLSIYNGISASVLIGYLQMRNSFIVAETPGIIMNFLNILVVSISVYFQNITFLAAGFLLSDILKYMLFPKALRKESYRHRWILNFKDPNIKRMLINSLPIILSIAATDLSTISDQAFASAMLEDGGVSAMRYASLILSLVSGVIIISITTSTYPSLSKFAHSNEMDKFKQTLVNSSSLSFILVLPAMVGIIVLAEPIIQILFQRGNFDAQSTSITSGVLKFYMPTIIGLALTQFYKRGFYAIEDTRTPIIVTIVQVTLNIFLNFILSRLIGLNGLALATSISSGVAGVLAIILFRYKYGRMNFSELLSTFLKTLGASILMGFVTNNVYSGLVGYNYILALIVSVIVSALVYGLMILFLRIPQVMETVNTLYHKIRG